MNASLNNLVTHRLSAMLQVVPAAPNPTLTNACRKNRYGGAHAGLRRGFCVASALLGMIAGGCEENNTSAAAPASSSVSTQARQDSNGVPEFVDSNFGFRATPPPGWQGVPSVGIQVPGHILQVWTPGDGATSIVAFVQEAGQAVTAKQLLDSSAAALKGAGYSIGLEEVTKVSGNDAMSLKVSGAGTGAALGSGTVQTYQHWVAIPRQNRVLVLLLTTPDATKAAAAKTFESMVLGVKID